MRSCRWLIWLLVVAAMAVAAPPSRDEMLQMALASGEKLWRGCGNDPPSRTLTAKDLFLGCLVLAEADRGLERVPRYLALATQMQERTPGNPLLGNFRWYWNQPTVQDANAVEFCMQPGALLWKLRRDRLPEASRPVLEQLLQLGLQGCQAHQVEPNYTNIALLNAANLIVLGEALNHTAAADEGYRRLGLVGADIWRQGIHEYDSPAYYGADLDALLMIEAHAARDAGREQARALLKLFFTDLSLNWFPAGGRLAGAHSRTYDSLHGHGYLDDTLAGMGWLTDAPTPGVGALVPLLSLWRPDETLRATAAKLPREVRQRWGRRPTDVKTTYITSDVALGTASAGYGTTDVPFAIDFAGGRDDVRCTFVPDLRGDPYGLTKATERTGTHQTVFHATPFWIAAQHTNWVLALAVYKFTTLPAGASSLQSHLILPRQNDGLWVGAQPVDRTQDTWHVPVPMDTPIAIRRGTALAVVRLLRAGALDGGEATAELVDDGNTSGAVRLTVTHHLPTGGKRPSWPYVAFSSTVGTGRLTPAQQEEWRRNASGNRPRFRIGPDGLDAEFISADNLSLHVPPSLEGAKLAPLTPRDCLLACDGSELGRALLQAVEPWRSLGAGTAP